MEKKKEVNLYRNCQVIFRVTPEEKQLLEKMANNNKLNLSSYMRQVFFIKNKKDMKTAREG